MSMTPTPWTKITLPCSVKCAGHFDIQGADGAEVLLAPIPAAREADVDRIVTAVNAFAALLAVAKAATDQATDERIKDDISPSLEAALLKLWQQHPGWQEWAP